MTEVDLGAEYIIRQTYKEHGMPEGFTLQRSDDGMMRYAAPPATDLGELGTVDEAVAAAQARSDSIAPPLSQNEIDNMKAMGLDPENNPASLTSYDPTMREDARFEMTTYLVDKGMDLGTARNLAEEILGNETAMKDLGVGLADMLGITLPMDVEEGVRQADRGLESDNMLDTAIGSSIALASAVPMAGGAVKAGMKIGKSKMVREFLDEAVKRFDEGKSPFPVGMSIEPVERFDEGKSPSPVGMSIEPVERFDEGKSPSPVGMSIEPVDRTTFRLDDGFEVDTSDMSTSDLPDVGNALSDTLPTMQKVLEARANEMKVKPSERTQPSGDTMFDTTPEGYNRTPSPQSPVAVPRAPDGKKLPKGDRATPVAAMNDVIAARLAERMRPHLGTAAQFFYHTGPLIEKAVALGIPEATARQQLKDFALNYAATSPRTTTDMNLRNASLTRSKGKAGIPLETKVGPGGDGINEKGYPMMIGESGIHRKLVTDIRGNQGINVNTNPKPYTFAENVGGNLDGVTVDTHAIRGALDAMNEATPGSIPDGFIKPAFLEQYKADPSQLDPAIHINDTLASQKVDGVSMQTEYSVFSDIYRKAAEILDVSPAEAQSLGWFGSGDRTGLASELKTIVDLINDRIDVTSQATGTSKDVIFKGFMEGSIPILSIGGAVLLNSGAADDGAIQ